MNSIHRINAINNKELQNNVPDNASWHTDYADTSYIYIGNLHENLKKNDLVAIFSQYGNPTHLNLIIDPSTGRSRGFAYLKYEDHRSCILAVDNFNGVEVYGRPLRVDHTYYKLRPGQSEDDFLVEYPKTKLLTASTAKLAKLTNQETSNNQDTSNPENPETSNTSKPPPSTQLPNPTPDDDFSDPMAGMLSK